MDKELKKEWLEALRSGKYEQGFGSLKNNKDKHCCLGVLGDLLVKKGHCSWTHDAIALSDGHFASYLLPDELEEVTGINYDVQSDLSEMNDVGYSFNEIADYIVKKL